MENKKTFLMVSLVAAIYLTWQAFSSKPQQQIATSVSQPSATLSQGSNNAAPSANPAAQTLKLGTETYNVSLSTKGGTIAHVSLGTYRGRSTENVQQLIGGGNGLVLEAPSEQWNYLSSVNYAVKSTAKDADGSERVVLSYEDDKVAVERTYIIRAAQYLVENSNSFNFKKFAPSHLFLGNRTTLHVDKAVAENEKRELIFNKAGSGLQKWSTDSVTELKEDLGEGFWTAFSSRYFLNALVDQSVGAKPQFQARPLENGLVGASLIYKVNGNTAQIPVKYFYGPKEIDTMKAVGNHLEAAVDFGWFKIFADPMLFALKWFYKYIHNYGLAIILLTVFVKLITYPLTLKSMKSMKEMQRIQPQIQKLRERYADDKERLNREMLSLMKSNGYNPMSGCFPILIQMPIFFALYNVLYGAIELYGQPFFGWIHDLSAKDPYYVTPIVLSAMMFLQQKMTPNTSADPAQQKMMMFMPVVFGFMMLWLPSGLTLYMLVNSVVSILQQVLINRAFVHPTGVTRTAVST